MKKSILMITPENKEINSFRKRQFNNFIQITMSYLAAFVDEAKYDVYLVDEYNQKIPYGEKFDLVAITVNTPNATHCYNISKHFREQGSKVVMGGPHVTLLPEEAMRNSDYIIAGEAEETWPQFLGDFYIGCAKKQYMCNSIPTLEGIPIPNRKLIGKRYLTKGAVFSTRGCPYKCSYCNLKQIYCDSFRTRPINEVIEDIKNIKGKYFVFWDDNFFGDIDYAKRLMTELVKLKKRWAAQVTLERCKDEELLRIAKESGCVYLFVGIESFSQEGLISVNKGINKVDNYKSMISLLHKYGISVQAGIIFGFDTDKKDIFQRTLSACNELGIDGVTVSILTPLPGTPIYEQMKNEGRLISSDWSFYNGKTRVAFQPNNMSADELYEGYTWFRKEFYSTKSIIKRMAVSRTNLLHGLVVNLGYKLSLTGTKKFFTASKQIYKREL